MTNQIEINFSVLIPQNNKESEDLLLSNEKHLTKQCHTVYQALLRGERLTTGIMYNKYHIGDGRARIRDLRKAGIQVRDKIIQNRFKEYFL